MLAPRATARVTIIVVVAAALGLSACGGSGGESPTSTPATTSASAFAELPESVLPAIPGMAYTSSSESRNALAKTHVGQTLSAFSGGISRDLVVDGRRVGGVQLYRFAPDVATADYARFLPMMAYTFTGATPTSQKLGGKDIQVVDPAPGTQDAVVAWTQRDGVVILWADDLATAKDYAGRFILRTL